LILIDTSGLIAAVDRRQMYHAEASRELLQPRRRILSPFVLAELDYLIERNGGQAEELRLLRDVAHGAYQLDPFSGADVAAAIEVIERYKDLGVGLADASIVVLAERHRCLDILTLDERHFRTMLGPGGSPFRLLPRDSGS
jgi:predicted nucleic acid-binding protein